MQRLKPWENQNTTQNLYLLPVLTSRAIFRHYPIKAIQFKHCTTLKGCQQALPVESIATQKQEFGKNPSFPFSWIVIFIKHLSD